jgi:hypothetical protein
MENGGGGVNHGELFVFWPDAAMRRLFTAVKASDTKSTVSIMEIRLLTDVVSLTPDG